MNILLDALFTFLPAGIANMAPVLAAKAPIIREWNYPLDCGASVGGIRIFGDHKTWRGFIIGTMLGTIWAYTWFHLLGDDGITHALWLGVLLSAGALIGDAIKSFFKRRAHVPSGKAWFPFDQTDYIVGGLLCSAFVLRPSILLCCAIFVLYFGLHVLVSYVGFLLGLKKDPI